MADTTRETLILHDPYARVHHDGKNEALSFRFLRAIAVEKAALDRDLPRACTFILAAILHFMNSQAERAWPSYQKIAELTGYSEDVIDKSIRKLKRAGYIFTERRSPITGGRALVHYGLRAVHPRDIDQMIAAAVAELRSRASNKTGPAENSGVRSKLTPPIAAGSNTESANFDFSDPVKFNPQKPCIEEPSVRESADARPLETFSNNQLEELHQLFNNWGRNPGTLSFNEIDRARSDRIMLDEIDACRRKHTDADEGHIQAAALVALNVLRSTRATGTHGGSMLRLFRKVMEAEIARKAIRSAPSTTSCSRSSRGPTSKIELARRAFESLRS